MFDVVAIGQRMKERREQLGLTMDEVAAHVGVTKSTISRYENGVITRIKLPVLESIAHALDMEPEELLDPNKTGAYSKPRATFDKAAYIDSLSEAEMLDMLQMLTAKLAERRNEK